MYFQIDPSIVRKQIKHRTDEEKDEIRRYHQRRFGHKRARKGHKKAHRKCATEHDCGHGMSQMYTIVHVYLLSRNLAHETSAKILVKIELLKYSVP